MERQNRPLVTDVERQLVLQDLKKRNVNPKVVEEVRRNFHRRELNSRNLELTTEVERELVLKHLEKSNANPRVIEEVRQDFYRRDMERQNRPLVTDVERQQLNSRNLELTTEVERQLVLKHLEKSNVNPRVIEEVRQDFHRRDMERR